MNFEMLCGLLPAEVHWGDPLTPQMAGEIVLSVREACAKEVDGHVGGETIAAAIRMRPNVVRVMRHPE